MARPKICDHGKTVVPTAPSLPCSAREVRDFVSLPAHLDGGDIWAAGGDSLAIWQMAGIGGFRRVAQAEGYRGTGPVLSSANGGKCSFRTLHDGGFRIQE